MSSPSLSYNMLTFAFCSTARYTVESILVPLEQGHTERQLRVPNGNWKIKDAIKLLGEVQGAEYTSNCFSIEEARDLQEKYRQNGEAGKELLMSLKALFASPYAAVPKPWDNDKFSFTPLTLEQIFKSFQG
jgi:hypothetical protein